MTKLGDELPAEIQIVRGKDNYKNINIDICHYKIDLYP